MYAEEDIFSSQDDLLLLGPVDPEWQTILHASNQVVLYNPTSHALSVQRRSPSVTGLIRRRERQTTRRCPFCHRSIPGEGPCEGSDEETDSDDLVEDELDERTRSRAPNYFQLLQTSNETTSIPSTPLTSTPRSSTPVGQTGAENPFRATNMAEGYFEAFFQEECRLGMGANGSVYLCRHVLNGNPLGHFAVKKIAVGQSSSYLLTILREVRLLESLHHPNIVTYHHAWLETCQFSSFGPKVPTLHVLMQWAEGGSLDDYIDSRLGRGPVAQIQHMHPSSSRSHSRRSSQGEVPTAQPTSPFSRGARIRAFRAMQHAPPEERERLRRELAGESTRAGGSNTTEMKAVHLLSAEEVKSLFQDVVEGLAFLHDKSILHLDLKPGNVLLTWDEGKLIPRAMLSDFGTSQDMLNSRARSGNTGTLEYASPESLPSPTGQLAQVDSKSDMWSLGMILHKLLFFRLPYPHASDSPRTDSRRDGKELADLLEREVLDYPGFKSTATLATLFDSRHLPRAILLLLESLLNVKPSARPSSERVLAAIREGKLDPVPKRSTSSSAVNALGSLLVPAKRRHSQGTAAGPSLPANQEGPSELPPWTEPGSREDPSAMEAEDGDKTPVLTLPAPPGAVTAKDSSWATLRVWNRKYVLDSRSSPVVAKRTLKSCLLVGKVWSLLKLSERTPDTSPMLLVLSWGLAIADTLSDGLTESVVLGLMHLGLLSLASH